MNGPARIILAVAAGAAIGSVLRALVGLGLADAGPVFGTIIVNVAGSFLMGFYATAVATGGTLATGPAHKPAMRAFVLTGFCGGFTTFSVFSLEALTLANSGDTAAATLHVVGSVVVWLAAVTAGAATARRWRG